MKRKIRNMNLVDFFHRNTSINKFNQEKLFYNIGKLYSTEKFLSESTVKPNEFSSNPNNIKLKNIENKDKFYLIFNERRTRRDFKKQNVQLVSRHMRKWGKWKHLDSLIQLQEDLIVSCSI